jgi:hypothetical protein
MGMLATTVTIIITLSRFKKFLMQQNVNSECQDAKKTLGNCLQRGTECTSTIFNSRKLPGKKFKADLGPSNTLEI